MRPGMIVITSETAICLLSSVGKPEKLIHHGCKRNQDAERNFCLASSAEADRVGASKCAECGNPLMLPAESWQGFMVQAFDAQGHLVTNIPPTQIIGVVDGGLEMGTRFFRREVEYACCAREGEHALKTSRVVLEWRR